MKNIIVSGVLRDGFNIYKNNFKQLIRVSLLYALIMLISTLFSIYTGLSESGLSFLLGFIIMFASMYFGIRVYISLIIIVRELAIGKQSFFRSAYNESIKYFWKTIGNSILTAIPIAVPSCLLAFVYRSEMSLIYKYPLILVLLYLIGLITTYLFFAPLSVVLKPNLTSRLRYSIGIVHGRMIKVFVILFCSIFVFLIPTHIINSIDFGSMFFPYNSFIRNIIINFFSLFVTPFSISVMVVLFNELTEKN